MYGKLWLGFVLNAGIYSLVRRISVCVICAGLTCATVDCSATSYPHFDKRVSFNAGAYSLVRRISVCVLCAGLTCAARAAAGHFLLPIAAKESKSAFCLPKQ